MSYLVLLDKSDKLRGKLVELILGLGLHELQAAGSRDNYRIRHIDRRVTTRQQTIGPEIRLRCDVLLTTIGNLNTAKEISSVGDIRLDDGILLALATLKLLLLSLRLGNGLLEIHKKLCPVKNPVRWDARISNWCLESRLTACFSKAACFLRSVSALRSAIFWAKVILGALTTGALTSSSDSDSLLASHSSYKISIFRDRHQAR